MKKTIAIVLTLMLLVASVAMAEEASVLVLADPVLTTNAGGQPMTIDMNGLEIALAIGNDANGVPTIQMDAANGGQSLLNAVLQFIGNRAVLDVDGLSRPIAATVSGVSADEIAEGFDAMMQPSGFKLPAFTGVEIPKLDLVSVGAMVGAGADGSFELSYQMVNMLLGQLSNYRGVIPGTARQYTDMLFDAIDQMQATNSGFTLKGNVADDGASATLALDILPVQNGVTASASVATITLYSAANQINLDVDVHQDGQDMKLGQFALTSIPAEAELNFSLDLMGELGLAGSLYPQDGAQVAAFELTAEGQKMNFSVTYGDRDAAQFADVVVSVEGQAAVECIVETTADESGAAYGTLDLTLDSLAEPVSQVNVKGDIMTAAEDYDFRSIDNAAAAIDAENMTEEESQQLSQEFDAISGNLMNYLATLAPAA